MTAITLTEDQDKAFNALVKFITDPNDEVFVLSGYSGTGKSTLVKYFLDRLDNIIKTAKLINPIIENYEVMLSATTNKAAENLEHIAKQPAKTIHSLLGLRVSKDWKTNTSRLVIGNKEVLQHKLVFIDEGSYVDSNLLGLIFRKLKNCKIIFMGDPAQLTPIKSNATPVFDGKFTGARLEKVVRQAEGNPIIELSTLFRNTVNTGEFFSFTPDGVHVQHMDRVAFDQAIVDEFSDPQWSYHQSKVLVWTNREVVRYNQAITNLVKGTPRLSEGDQVTCNSYVSKNRVTIRTDQLVQITRISDPVIRLGVQGRDYSLAGKGCFFGPDCIEQRKAALNLARKEGRYGEVEVIDSEWVDLRPVYACTVDKSQGSTYDKVFIDLDDISKCHNGNQIARMLYVAVSRARTNVYLTGDLV